MEKSLQPIQQLVPVLSAQEFAERRGVAVGTLANWRCQGKGPKFLPGKPIQYRLDAIEAWELEQQVSSTAQAK